MLEEKENEDEEEKEKKERSATLFTWSSVVLKPKPLRKEDSQ
jgi:hypothetical protein